MYNRYQGASKMAFAFENIVLAREAKGWICWRDLVAAQRAAELLALQQEKAHHIQVLTYPIVTLLTVTHNFYCFECYSYACYTVIHRCIDRSDRSDSASATATVATKYSKLLCYMHYSATCRRYTHTDFCHHTCYYCCYCLTVCLEVPCCTCQSS
jgi:hypothetical protein